MCPVSCLMLSGSYSSTPTSMWRVKSRYSSLSPFFEPRTRIHSRAAASCPSLRRMSRVPSRMVCWLKRCSYRATRLRWRPGGHAHRGHGRMPGLGPSDSSANQPLPCGWLWSFLSYFWRQSYMTILAVSKIGGAGRARVIRNRSGNNTPYLLRPCT